MSVVWPVLRTSSPNWIGAICFLGVTFWIASFMHLSWTSTPRQRLSWLVVVVLGSFVIPFLGLVLTSATARNAFQASLITGLVGGALGFYVARRRQRELASTSTQEGGSGDVSRP